MQRLAVDRLALSEAERLHPIGVDAALEQIAADRVGSALGEAQVVFLAGATVGVALDRDHCDLGVVLDHLGHVVPDDHQSWRYRPGTRDPVGLARNRHFLFVLCERRRL